MSQVIVKVTPAVFYNAMNFNARRRSLIRDQCSSAEQVVLAISQRFGESRDKRVPPAQRTGHGNSVEHRDALTKFYRERAIVRCAVEGNDQRGGYVVLDGELIGFHHIDREHGDWMMHHAVSDGAVRLNCFDEPHLIGLYGRFGFREVRREPNHTPDKPDVIFMEREV